jgi:hypothetical protein
MCFIVISILLYYYWNKWIKESKYQSFQSIIYERLITSSGDNEKTCNILTKGIIEFLSPLDVTVCLGYAKESIDLFNSEKNPSIVAYGKGANELKKIVNDVMILNLDFAEYKSCWDHEENKQLKKYRENGIFDCLSIISQTENRLFSFGIAGRGCDFSQSQIHLFSKIICESENVCIVSKHLSKIENWDSCFKSLKTIEETEDKINQNTILSMWEKKQIPPECSLWWETPELRRIGIDLIIEAYKKNNNLKNGKVKSIKKKKSKKWINKIILLFKIQRNKVRKNQKNKSHNNFVQENSSIPEIPTSILIEKIMEEEDLEIQVKKLIELIRLIADNFSGLGISTDLSRLENQLPSLRYALESYKTSKSDSEALPDSKDLKENYNKSKLAIIKHTESSRSAIKNVLEIGLIPKLHDTRKKIISQSVKKRDISMIEQLDRLNELAKKPLDFTETLEKFIRLSLKIIKLFA